MLLLLCQQKEVFPPSHFWQRSFANFWELLHFLAAYFFGNCSLPCSCYGRWLPFSQRSNHCLSYNIVFFRLLLLSFAGNHSTTYFLLFFNATCCSAVEFCAVRSTAICWPYYETSSQKCWYWQSFNSMSKEQWQCETNNE